MSKKRCCLTHSPDLRPRIPGSRGIAPNATLWETGKVLSVRFMEGTAQQKEFVRRVAVKWSEFANIQFDFNEARNAEIRITFDENGGAWSTVGTDGLSVPLNEPTMNLGWVDESVVLHEFGHAIGLGHEHQNPVGGIQWNKPVVYAELAGPPNNWDKATVDHNLFDKYDENQIQATVLDPLSIMMYPIDESWTLNDFSTSFNENLSELDKSFVGSLYPMGAVVTEPVVPVTPVDDGIKKLAVSVFTQYEAEIAKPGTQHEFSFEVKEAGRYIIETTGNTDMYLTLLGPTDATKVITTDDDSGESRNSKITQDLNPGTYFLQVRHYDKLRGVGPYSISIVTAKKVIIPNLEVT